MEQVSTLNFPSNRLGGRALGNTTRQVDFAIDQLFQGKEILVQDHYHLGTHKPGNDHLFDMIMKRIMLEHSKYLESRKKVVMAMKGNLTIKLIDVKRED